MKRFFQFKNAKSGGELNVEQFQEEAEMYLSIKMMTAGKQIDKKRTAIVRKILAESLANIAGSHPEKMGILKEITKGLAIPVFLGKC
ncbi:MAG: hypothetical protein AAB851_00855 [Patescibacteria group bacterium]